MNNIDSKLKADSDKTLMNFMWVWPAIHGRVCSNCDDRRGVPINWGNCITYTNVSDACKKCPVAEGEAILMKCLGYAKVKEGGK